MHQRRLASFLLGCWIAGILGYSALTYQTLFESDQLLSTTAPRTGGLVQRVGVDAGRLLLRYGAAEQQRLFATRWEWTEIVIALLLAGSLYLSRHISRILLIVVGIMVLLSLFMHFALTPEISWIGRESVSGPNAGTFPARFWVLEGLYAGLQVLKLVAGLSIAIYLFYFRPSHRTHSDKPAEPPVVRSVV